MAVVLHSRGISCFWSEVFFAFDFVIGESFEVRLERECRVSLMISQLMIYQRDDTLLSPFFLRNHQHASETPR